ncbi:hypothetical protein MSIMFI_02656 [Mycobacterium simulans]|uniref:hypothetical protein n=1 Tax=Mycobacterium simulans TaxID=627089 RepID=UPI001748AAFE|nr:hypothetical protein [Mycobacterium simulans]SON61151.1 hypothetical protein MSIMFI_02656 [Mycobacterium simulans]
MSRLRILISATIAAAASIGFLVADPVATAEAPAPGDPCTVLHATTQDANGRTMWCNPTMTGTHSLVWQYGGPD